VLGREDGSGWRGALLHSERHHALQRGHGALELHNLFSVNGSDLSFHMGGEIVPLSWLSVRDGYDRSGFVFGAGVKLGPVRLDAAAGTDYCKLLSAGLYARF